MGKVGRISDRPNAGIRNPLLRRDGILFALCSSRPQPPQLLLTVDPLSLPAPRLFAELKLLGTKLLLAGGQPGCLLLAFLLAAGGPTIEPPFLLDHRLVLSD